MPDATYPIGPFDPDRLVQPADRPAMIALTDAASGPVEDSLLLLDGVHARWAYLMQALDAGEWTRRYLHPEQGREYALTTALANYAWHSEHHLAHVRIALG
jgi:hypothetical protein